MHPDHPFHEWIRLEQPRLGTRVVFATDDFFADKSRLIDAAEPVFVPGKYDDHGKWMDGWESRRRRDGGYDYCIVRLGKPGVVHGFDVDTSYFTGNYPPAVSIDACVSDEENPGEGWFELVPRTGIDGDAHNFLSVDDERVVTHLRLNIYPDGGVARLHVYGEVRYRGGGDSTIDLVALEHGGRALCCSDEHYGSMQNLVVAGRGADMGDGWETARRRGPGNDWVVLALGTPGTIECIEIDTAHFKGNYPDRASIRAAMIDSPRDIATASAAWPIVLPETRLRADFIHAFREGLQNNGVVSHVRMDIYPDGGVSRLRIFGRPATDRSST
ncbi:MAG: allantoicase [Gammaproteobacteria bacterium]|nr:allantoicase [Gammaproteobacteria bacterium]